MVEGRTEEDDEDTFGSFSFAPTFLNNNSHIINNIHSNYNVNDKDDDDWGDFVESPLRSNLPNNNNNKGPLPLSLFGQLDDDDDDVKPGSVDNGFVFSPNNNGSNSDFNGKDLGFGEKYGNVSGLSLDSDKNVKSGDFSGLGKGDISGLSSDYGLVDKRRDFLSLGKGNLSGLRSNSDLITKSMDFSRIQIDDFSGLSLNSDSRATSGDFSSLGKVDISGLRSNSDLVANSIDLSRIQTDDLSGLGLNYDLIAKTKSGDFSSLAKEDLSRFGSDSDLFSRTGPFSSPGKEDLSGLSSGFDLVAKSGDLSSRGNGNLNGLSSNFDMFSVDNGLRFSSDLFDVKNGDHGTQMKDTNGDNIVGLHSNLNGLVSSTPPPSGNEEFDADDDAWEFKDAYSELNVDTGVKSKLQENSKVTGSLTQAVNGSHESINFFSSAADRESFKSIGTGLSAVAQNGLALYKLETVAQNGLSSDSFFSSKQSGFDGGQNSDPLESNEWGGNFHGALTGNGLNEEDIPTSGKASQSEVEVLSSNGKTQVNELRANNYNEALPLALFGEEELASYDYLNAQEDILYKPSSTQEKGISNEGSNYSIHDVISTLYSQPQQNSPVNYPEKQTDNGLNLRPSDEVLSHIPEDLDEDLDDGSWEFKDASAITHALELSSHLVFYRKLEKQLTLVCRCHIDNLKKARDTASFSGDDLEVARIEEEIQEACKELQEETLNFQDHSDNQTLRETCLNEFLEVLNEPKFQILESQHGISTKLHLARKDLTSAIEAVNHTKSKLNILTIGSSDDQYNYVSTWSKILSVCAQELKHGSWIWKQSIGNNLQSHMVSDPRGKDFVTSLAEIYRVVIILRASTKLFEPWILSTNSISIFSLFEDCNTLWSSLSIEEALNLHVNNEYQSTVKELLDSIKRVHELDELALQDLVLHQQVSTCRLSLLNSKVIPEISRIMWNGETFFVTLANLWVNLISCDLPDLPHLRVGS